MFKTIFALIMIAPLAPALAQPQPLSLPHTRGKSGTEEDKAAVTDPLANYGGSKGRHEAAVAAFQAAYEAAAGPRHDRAIRLFLVSLRREPMAKSLYDLGILCARDYRWDDAISFQREAQQQTADAEVAKLAAVELERLQTIVDLEGSPAGKELRAYDIRFMQVLNKAKDPYAELADLKEIVKQYDTRWEAPALAGILYADVHKYPESRKAFEDAARLAPSDRRQHLQAAAELARREATFTEQRIAADELWEKKEYESAAQHYAAAWENGPGRLEVGLLAATGYLMADRVNLAVEILSRMRASATGEMGGRIVAMLKELGAVSEEAKIQAARAPGASGGSSVVDTPAQVRTLVGQLTSSQMEVAAKSDPPLLDDKTNFIHVPDEELTGGQSNLPLLSGERIYDLYKRDQATPNATPGSAEPPANPPNPAPPGLPPAAAAKPAPVADLPLAMPPLSVAEPARPSAEAPHVPGETAVSVIGDPPGALVAFDDHDSLQCTTPCQIFLAAGRHTWRATLSGYRDGLGVFTIEKGKKPSSVKVSLDAKVGFVTVESNIAGQPIFLNGQKTDYLTPSRLKLPEGVYKVSVEIDGKIAMQEVSVRDGAFIKVPF
jgi:tetratricopeptide (TPR) repeat protein